MKLIAITLSFLYCYSQVDAWTFNRVVPARATTRTQLFQLTDNDPCWQDIYGDDDDCGMSTVFSANFVAEKWIKSMPCAAGIEVCSKQYFQFCPRLLRFDRDNITPHNYIALLFTHNLR